VKRELTFKFKGDILTYGRQCCHEAKNLFIEWFSKTFIDFFYRTFTVISLNTFYSETFTCIDFT